MSLNWGHAGFQSVPKTMSSHTDTVVASKRRSRSQLEAMNGTTMRLPGPSRGGPGPGQRGGGILLEGGGGPRLIRSSHQMGPKRETSLKNQGVRDLTCTPQVQTSHILAVGQGCPECEREYKGGVNAR